MYSIPTSIEVGGKSFRIRCDGDFRMLLDCFKVLDDIELDKTERIIATLLIFYADFNSINDIMSCSDILRELVEKMFWFFNCGSEDSPGTKTNYKLIDWEGDAQLVSSAVNKVAGTEIRALEYLHWWTFMGYYSAIGESTLSTIVGIRHKIVEGKPLEKYERKFRQDNPQYFNWDHKTIEEHEAEDIVLKMWNSGG